MEVTDTVIHGVNSRDAAEKGDIYKCNRCGLTFVRGEVGVSCTVLHSKGDCCHYEDSFRFTGKSDAGFERHGE